MNNDIIKPTSHYVWINQEPQSHQRELTIVDTPQQWAFFVDISVDSQPSLNYQHGELQGYCDSIRSHCRMWNRISDSVDTRVPHTIQLYKANSPFLLNQEVLTGGTFTLRASTHCMDPLCLLIHEAIICNAIPHSCCIVCIHNTHAVSHASGIH